MGASFERDDGEQPAKSVAVATLGGMATGLLQVGPATKRMLHPNAPAAADTALSEAPWCATVHVSIM